MNIQPTTSIEGSNIFSPHINFFSRSFAHFVCAYVYICTYINATGLMFDSDDRNGEEKEKKKKKKIGTQLREVEREKKALMI